MSLFISPCESIPTIATLLASQVNIKGNENSAILRTGWVHNLYFKMSNAFCVSSLHIKGVVLQQIT